MVALLTDPVFLVHNSDLGEGSGWVEVDEPHERFLTLRGRCLNASEFFAVSSLAKARALKIAQSEGMSGDEVMEEVNGRVVTLADKLERTELSVICARRGVVSVHGPGLPELSVPGAIIDRLRPSLVADFGNWVITATVAPPDPTGRAGSER